MWGSRARIGALLAALLLAAAPLRAWQDPFGQWTAGAYLQVLEINRPAGGLPPTGSLDAWGDAAGGYTWDGLHGRALDIRLTGPLGFDGFSAALETSTDFNATALADCFAQWDSPAGTLRLGQEYLPFGAEEQVSKKDLVTIQRGLAWGFENYGHVQPWGLQLASQRGWGLRWDGDAAADGFRVRGQAGAFEFGSGDCLNVLGGGGRVELAWSAGWAGASAGWSTLLGRAHLETPPAQFVPLGAPQGAEPVQGAGFGGPAPLLAWGPDARLDLGPLHGSAEIALESLDHGMRGGGQATAWLDCDGALRALGAGPGWSALGLYARWEQASSSFADGVHRAGSLFRAATLGVRLPLGWAPASLKVERLRVSDDDFGGILPDGDITQAQLQLVL